MTWVMRATVEVDAEDEWEAEVLCLAACLRADEVDFAKFELDRGERPFEPEELIDPGAASDRRCWRSS